MNNEQKRTMRDAMIESIYHRMDTDKNIFFLSADMGAPLLDKIRIEYKDRFVNVGIAEQNLVNVAAGLALEGYTVYAYAIASFLLRPFEQIRVNLALSSQKRTLNVNMIGVGSGVSYDVSGPTHHCLEDISVMRTLPNIVVCSPSDWYLAQAFVEYSVRVTKPKYIRLDGKPLPTIYDQTLPLSFDDGYYELIKGHRVCIVSTGYMTHVALQLSRELKEFFIGVLDLFLLRPINEAAIFNILKRYDIIITLEEAFVGKGGLDSLVSGILNKNGSGCKIKSFGFKDEYLFKFGNRDYLYKQSGLDKETMREWIMKQKI